MYKNNWYYPNLHECSLTMTIPFSAHQASLKDSSFQDIHGGATVFRGNRMISPYNDYEMINTWDTTPVLGLITNIVVSIVIFTGYLQCNIDNRRAEKVPIVYGFGVAAATLATYVSFNFFCLSDTINGWDWLFGGWYVGEWPGRGREGRVGYIWVR